MQIKRFEAADMTEALRMVKRELGDDAVILSAKEVRPRGFFSALKKKHVEITAATDYPTEEASPEEEFTGLLAQQLGEIATTDRVSLSTPKRVPSPQIRSRTALDNTSVATANDRPDTHAAARREHASELTARHHRRERRQADAHRRSARRHGAYPWEPLGTQPFYEGRNQRQIVAVVGPSGTGKSTAVAKLAWHCRTVRKQPVGLISFDRFRMAANCMLDRLADIVDVPLHVAHDADELQAALTALSAVDTILLDTPGMGSADQAMLAAVQRLLAAARPDETHLVLNATVRDDVLSAAVETYRPLAPTHFLLTHLDECTTRRSVVDWMGTIGLPAAFFSDGIDLDAGLKTTANGGQQSASGPDAPIGGQVTVFPGRSHSTRHATRSGGSDSPQYLANRNSELFHEPACKSVKRIHSQNIVAFNSIEQALSGGFKPCRACCNIDMIRKMVSADAAAPRARAM